MGEVLGEVGGCVGEVWKSESVGGKIVEMHAVVAILASFQ